MGVHAGSRGTSTRGRTFGETPATDLGYALGLRRRRRRHLPCIFWDLRWRARPWIPLLLYDNPKDRTRSMILFWWGGPGRVEDVPCFFLITEDPRAVRDPSPTTSSRPQWGETGSSPGTKHPTYGSGPYVTFASRPLSSGSLTSTWRKGWENEGSLAPAQPFGSSRTLEFYQTGKISTPFFIFYFYYKVLYFNIL